MLDRTVAPKANPIASQKLILPEVIKTKGTNIYHFANNTIPVVKLEFVLGLNSIHEVAKGVNFFCVKMLQEGTSNYSSSQISELFSQKGAFLEITPGIKRSSIVVYCLSHHVKELLPLIYDLITDAVFPENQLEKLKEQSINTLKVNKAKNAYLAAKSFSSNLFGAEHHYGRQLNEAEIQSIENGSLITQHADFIQNTHIDAFLTGQLEAKDIQGIEAFLNNLNATQLTSTPIHIQTPSQFRVVDEISDAIQSTIKIGKLTITKHHEDYPGLYLLNEIFGGYFGSRLMTNLREEKGLTYGIYSRLRAHVECSIFEISADVRKADRELAANEIMKELEHLLDELVGEEELNKVKHYISGSLLNSFGSIFDHSDKFKTLHYQQLPLDYYDKLQEKIYAVKADNIQELAKQYLVPATMNFVTVG